MRCKIILYRFRILLFSWNLFPRYIQTCFPVNIICFYFRIIMLMMKFLFWLKSSGFGSYLSNFHFCFYSTWNHICTVLKLTQELEKRVLYESLTLAHRRSGWLISQCWNFVIQSFDGFRLWLRWRLNTELENVFNFILNNSLMGFQNQNMWKLYLYLLLVCKTIEV